MLLFGHLGFSFVIGDLIGRLVSDKSSNQANIHQKWSNNNIHPVWFCLGAMLPDIVDKTLFVLISASGRGFGHTLIFLLLISGISWGFRGVLGNRIPFSLILGNTIHLGLDTRFYTQLFDSTVIPFLWPVSPTEFAPPYDLFANIWKTLSNPYVLETEILGFTFLILLVLVYWDYWKLQIEKCFSDPKAFLFNQKSKNNSIKS